MKENEELRKTAQDTKQNYEQLLVSHKKLSSEMEIMNRSIENVSLALQKQIKEDLDSLNKSHQLKLRQLEEKIAANEKKTISTNLSGESTAPARDLEEVKQQQRLLRNELTILRKERDEAKLSEARLRNELDRKDDEISKLRNEVSLLISKVDDNQLDTNRFQLALEEALDKIRLLTSEIYKTKETTKFVSRTAGRLSEDTKELVRLQTQATIQQELEMERQKIMEIVTIEVAKNAVKRVDTSKKLQIQTPKASLHPPPQPARTEPTERRTETSNHNGGRSYQKHSTPKRRSNPEPSQANYNSSRKISKPSTRTNPYFEKFKKTDLSNAQLIFYPTKWPVSLVPQEHRHKIRLREGFRTPHCKIKQRVAYTPRKENDWKNIAEYDQEDLDLEFSDGDRLSDQIASAQVDEIREWQVEELAERENGRKKDKEREQKKAATKKKPTSRKDDWSQTKLTHYSKN
eukprot:TRINITY_DN7565_c0_g1_i1.p1 TRINITY_DN7565_c0_g1~~TRINITY_DN7565_c0_g1_i1.p1  ORF type:complete len:461 (+),score=89.40 TRINITY_DN7565_c0_g1_i1:1364-2746(+)